MNYRHAFHAGNFADLLKHAALTLCLDAFAARRVPATLIDTHAGAGVYDLGGEEAKKSGEAAVGVGRLIADPHAPEALDMLAAAVARINGAGQDLRFYPGSPMLIASALRDGDRLVACELRPEEHAQLAELLASFGQQANARKADGYSAAVAETGPGRSTFVIIDPPFERGDDYARIVETCAAVLAKDGRATILIWMPLKDLETFDRFLRDLEAINPGPVLIAECRLRPLDNPMAMNGCALAVINPPTRLKGPLTAANEWIVETVGEGAGESRVWDL